MKYKLNMGIRFEIKLHHVNLNVRVNVIVIRMLESNVLMK